MVNIKHKNNIGEITVRDADKIQVFENGDVIIRTVYEGEGDYLWDMYQHEEEWREIDDLIATYQAQFKEDADDTDRFLANDAGTQLLKRFQPLFKKYVTLLKTGQINFKNSEQRQFVRLFIDTPFLKNLLNKKTIQREYCEQIAIKFNFLVEGYGNLPEDEIYDDLHVLFFTLAKRYKNVGRSFCCYIYNLFKYEVARFVSKYQANPANFHYKVTTLEEENIMPIMDDYSHIEEIQYEDAQGLPDKTWIAGETCSDLFKGFSRTDRMIFSRYYLQDWNDAQIATMLGIHINTANQRRKAIVQRLCKKCGFSPEDIVRHRKSGKRAVINTTI